MYVIYKLKDLKLASDFWHWNSAYWEKSEGAKSLPVVAVLLQTFSRQSRATAKVKDKAGLFKSNKKN